MGAEQKTWSIRRYRDGDAEQINELYNTIFGQKRSLDDWTWRFCNNPAGGLNLIAVAEAEGKIIGQYSSFPILFKYGSDIILVDQPVDNSIHPRFQGQGIQRAMFELLDCEIRPAEKSVFAFGFPNPAHYIIGKRSLGYKDLGDFPMLYRRLNWRLALRKRAAWLPHPLLETIRNLTAWGYKNLIAIKPCLSFSSIRVEQVKSFDTRMDRFWERVKDSYQILAVRNQRYLNWRYVERPGGHYLRFIVRREEEILGYAILKIAHERDDLVGYIADLLTLPDRSTEDALIQGFLIYLYLCRTDYALGRFLEEDRVHGALRRHGFVERGEFPPIPVVYTVSPYGRSRVQETMHKDRKSWHLCLGDLDAI